MTNNHGFRFREWDIYKDSRDFRIKINKLLKTYPSEEKYTLIDQTKRALNSILLALAEGANKDSDKETRVYINRAHTSLDEVVACLDCALDDSYINPADHESALADAESLAKRLRAFNQHLSERSSSTIKDHRYLGFTLIEALVASSVFAFVVASVIGVYLATLQLDTKNRGQRAVAQNTRFIMEFLAKEIRNGSIDYPLYPSGTVSGTNDLYIENQANEHEHIYLSGNNIVLDKTGVGNTYLNSSGVTASVLKFYVSPSTTPFTSAKTVNQQPSVTVVLQLNSNYGQRPGDIATLNLQSTFTARNYPSRQ